MRECSDTLPSSIAELEQQMLARLGQVIYWATTATAVLMIGVMAFDAVTSSEDMHWGPAFGWALIAFFIWVFGRAALYVLAGK